MVVLAEVVGFKRSPRLMMESGQVRARFVGYRGSRLWGLGWGSGQWCWGWLAWWGLKSISVVSQGSMMESGQVGVSDTVACLVLGVGVVVGVGVGGMGSMGLVWLVGVGVKVGVGVAG